MLKKIVVSVWLFINCYCYKAIIVTPIADLLGQSFKQIDTKSKQSAEEFYYKLSPSVEYSPCNRINQVLFHDIVDIVNEKGKEVQMQTSDTFFSNDKDKYVNKFWTLKKNTLPLSKISKSEIRKIPQINSFKEKKKSKHNYVTLIQPFRGFSAGTNFVMKEKKDQGYTVFVFDSKKKRFGEIFIPKNYIFNHTSNPIRDFVNILRKWAHQSGVIPYVWGGTSFCNTFVKNHNPEEFHKRLSKRKIKPGMDCAGLIYRAAQIAGLPYYFKNTRTLSENLKPLEKNERIENGDLIFFPGHVIAISNTYSNRCVEARGYSHGYGYIHEIQLNKLFKNVNTFTELKRKYFNKEPLERLDSDNKVIRIIKNFKILKLKSCFKWKYGD